MKNCGSCANYEETRLHGIICSKTGQPAGYLQVKPCWVEKVTDTDAMKEKQKSGSVRGPLPMGRRPQFPNIEDENGQVLKHCRICGEYKPIDDFPRNRSHKDGHGSECRTCHNKATMDANRRRREARKAAEAKRAAEGKKAEPLPARERCEGTVLDGGIDWESFRLETAKDILCASDLPTVCLLDESIMEKRCRLAVKWADELIRQLREGK